MYTTQWIRNNGISLKHIGGSRFSDREKGPGTGCPKVYDTFWSLISSKLQCLMKNLKHIWKEKLKKLFWYKIYNFSGLQWELTCKRNLMYITLISYKVVKYMLKSTFQFKGKIFFQTSLAWWLFSFQNHHLYEIWNHYEGNIQQDWFDKKKSHFTILYC